MAGKRGPQRPRRPAFFESESLDQLLSMLLQLATEIWVVRERLYTLERAAERLGVPLSAAVEGYRLTEAESGELASMRQRMLTELMRNVGRPHQKTSRSVFRKRARRGAGGAAE